MNVRRLSISVPPEVEESIKAAAERAGMPVSSWLAAAAAERAAREAALADGRAAVEEFEAEHGVIPEEYRREARRSLTEHGLLGDTRAAG
ncbi:MAG: hypothetical protein ACRDPT_14890 [Streptomycetales bacterium]